MSNVMIIGVGGAGCNMAETFKREAKSEQLKTARYVFIGLEEDLDNHQKDDGRILWNVSRNIPSHFFAGVKRAFILAGMGGRTGTTMASIIAKMAKSAGVGYVAAVITLPFHFEGVQHIQRALEGATNIKMLNLDLVISLDNERLSEKYADLNLCNAFDFADNAVLNAVEDSFETGY